LARSALFGAVWQLRDNLAFDRRARRGLIVTRRQNSASEYPLLLIGLLAISRACLAWALDNKLTDPERVAEHATQIVIPAISRGPELAPGGP
jgi:hypothetical protein